MILHVISMVSRVRCPVGCTTQWVLLLFVCIHCEWHSSSCGSGGCGMVVFRVSSSLWSDYSNGTDMDIGQCPLLESRHSYPPCHVSSTSCLSAHRVRSSCWRSNLLLPSMKCVAFQLFLTRSDMSSFRISLVSLGATS